MSGRCGLAVAVAALLALGWPGAAGAGPRLVLSPPRLAFDSDGGAQVIRLHNRGDAPLQLKALAFSADSAGFSTEQLVPQQLAPGQALAVTVTYAPSGRRPQAFGALLVYSDDPEGFDDPRSEERDYVRGAALAAGETAATLGLWLPPLLAAGLLLAGRRLNRRWLQRCVLALGILSPLATSLWLAWHFDPGFTVLQGNYGIQLGLHRVLWPALGLELWTGLDGLALTLSLLLATAAALRLPGAAREAGTGAASLLLLHGGAQLVLCTLDAGGLLVGWELGLLGAYGRLGGWERGPAGARGRGARAWLLGAQLGALLLGGALGVARAHSLATALVDGTTVAHTADLVKLGYGNYFGDLALHGVPLDRLLWAALTLGALLPGALLLVVRTAVGERLLLSVPLLTVGVSATVRLAFYLLPQATVALAPWLVGAALAWGLGFTLRALRQRTLAQLLGAALVARAGTVFLGLLGATQAGAQAALLQLCHHALAATLLALPTAAGSERRPRPATSLLAALLILDAPGMLGFGQRVLLVLGIFPGLRVAAGVTTLASCLLTWAALRLTLRRPAPSRPRPLSAPAAGELALGAGLAALATGLGVWTQPLLDLSRGFVSDFLSHVFTHLDASTVALLVH